VIYFFNVLANLFLNNDNFIFSSPSPRFEKDTSQEEYVECYQGATQLFAEIDPEENLKDCGEESNDASEDDFIASSQVKIWLVISLK